MTGIGSGRLYSTRSAGRDSGVEWLGRIPQHWRVARLKDHVRVVNGFPFDSEFFSRDRGLPLVRIRDLSDTETEILYDGPMVEDALIENGDIVVGMDGAFNVARWKGDKALLNQRTCCLRVNDSLDAQFVFYLLPYPLRIINDLTYSTTVKHLSSVDVGRIRIGLPPIAEQRAIAAFLDRETARIDALIAKKEGLLALLDEKRTALITRAVTKGLDPAVPMKDSGVEWLGEVPAHWDITPLRWALSVQSGEALSNAEFELTRSEEHIVPVIGGNGVMGYGDRSNAATPRIAVGRVGALCGNVHLVDPPAWVTDNALVLSEIRGFDRQYLALLLEALDLNRWASQNAQPLITGGFVKAQRVCRPPLAEQQRIVEHLRKQTAAIRALSGRIRDAIALLREYRTALISAAVTGQIDVSGEVDGGGGDGYEGLKSPLGREAS